AALAFSLSGISVGHQALALDAGPALNPPSLSMGSSEDEDLGTINKWQDVPVSGTVVDQNGDPIPGATISIPGTGIGTATDLDGKYSLSVPEGSTLVFSFIGYVS